MKKYKYSTDINGTTKYEKRNTRKNTFIQRKECSLSSSRGKPPVEKNLLQ
jgi:hypothetical protein